MSAGGAVGLASAILVGHEVLVAVCGGVTPEVEYLALTLLLTGLLPFVVGLGVRPVPEPRRAAAWGALTAGLALGAAFGPFAGLGAAAVLLAVLWTAPDRGLGERAIALGVAAGIALALDGIPALAGFGGGVFARAPLQALPAATVTGSVVLVVFLVDAGLGRRGLTLAVALVIALGTPLEALWRTPSEAVPEPLRPEPALAADAPHVLIVVLDTVRADQLSLYGHARDTTPQLAGFLAERPRAVVHPAALSNGSWTVPSHASLLTGRLPSGHGAHLGSPAAALSVRSPATLAEQMRAAGWRTIAVFANPWLRRVEGLERGFEVYTLPPHRLRLPALGEGLRSLLVPAWLPDALEPSPSADTVLESFDRHLDACEEAPCFGLLNLLDAHGPYVPSPACRGRFVPVGPRESFDATLRLRTSEAERERLRARYDEEICDLDHALVAWLERLEARGFLDRAWVFVTADHGESFGEHGTTEHGTSVYDEQVRVPLVILPPRGVAPVPVTGVASLVDVAATAAAVAGMSLAGPGRDLREPAPLARASVEFFGDPAKVHAHGEAAGVAARAVRVGRAKLVARGGALELYDVVTDPSESRDRSTAEPERVEALRKWLPPLERVPPRARAERPLSARDREALRALGYLE